MALYEMTKRLYIEGEKIRDCLTTNGLIAETFEVMRKPN